MSKVKFNIAVYTADHGLEWHYDRQSIRYGELDRCRTILSPLPNFDAGDLGYEGVALIENRAFFIRCFSAQKWDFSGRNATYLVVAWTSRDEAKSLNVERVLSMPMLNEPTQ